jgi:hypothetical protein
MGLVEPKSIFQTDSMDEALRNRLYNCLLQSATPIIAQHWPTDFGELVWDAFFKRSVRDIEHFERDIERFFKEGNWAFVYDLIEFVANSDPLKDPFGREFIDRCNQVLVEECSGFRFVNTRITPVVSPEEIESIETALRNRVPQARQHLANALDLLAARANPNYAKSIQESISAVEAELRDVTGSESATIGDAIKAVKRGAAYHPVLLSALEKLYGWTNADGGIRHADKGTGQPPDRALAKFLLVTCCAFVNHLEELRSQP